MHFWMMEDAAFVRDRSRNNYSYMSDFGWLLHEFVWRSFRKESAKVDVVAK